MTLPFSTKNPYRFPESGVSSSSSSSSVVPDVALYPHVIQVYAGGSAAYSGSATDDQRAFRTTCVNVMGSLSSSTEDRTIAVADQYLASTTGSIMKSVTDDTWKFYDIQNDGTYFYAVGKRETATPRGGIIKYNSSGVNLAKITDLDITIYKCVVTGGNILMFAQGSTRYGFLKLDTATLATTGERVSATSHNISGMCTDGTSIFATPSNNADIVKITISSMAVAAQVNLTIGGNSATCTGICTDGTDIYVAGIAGGSGYIAKLDSTLGTVSAAYTGTVGADAILEYANGYIYAYSTNTVRVFDTSCVYQKTITASGGLALSPLNSNSIISRFYVDSTYLYLSRAIFIAAQGGGSVRIKHSLSGTYTSTYSDGSILTWTTADSFSSSSGTTAAGTNIWASSGLLASTSAGTFNTTRDFSSVPIPLS